MASEVVTHCLGRCVQSVEPRRVALMLMSTLLCARLFQDHSHSPLHGLMR